MRKFNHIIPAIIITGVMGYLSSSASGINTDQDSGILSYEALIDSAENLTKDNCWDQAASFYRRALKLNPGSPLNSKIFANLGLCLTHAGKTDEALEAYDIALVKEPESPAILTGKSSTLILTGDFIKAEQNLSKALSTDSLFPDALRLHGQLMLMNNDIRQAGIDFERLSRVAPYDSWGPGGMAEVSLAQNDLKEAIHLFNKALQLNDNSDFRISLIACLLRSNLLADAENTIRESITLYPQQGEFYFLRATLNKLLHQNRQAELDKKYAVEYGVDPQIIDKYLPAQLK